MSATYGEIKPHGGELKGSKGYRLPLAAFSFLIILF